MGYGGKEDSQSFILLWAFLWDGDVRWLVGLYISPSRRERDYGSTERTCSDELGAKRLHRDVNKREPTS